ncbi:hypothetical protein U1Q18_018343 [Sarracenia purpurea var. burkii]
MTCFWFKIDPKKKLSSTAFGAGPRASEPVAMDDGEGVAGASETVNENFDSFVDGVWCRSKSLGASRNG